MANKPETVFRARVMPKFKSIPFSKWISIQQKSITGTPDVLGCVNGRFVALEFKSGREYGPSDLQKYTLGKINDARGMNYVVYPDNWEEIYNEVLTTTRRRI